MPGKHDEPRFEAAFGCPVVEGYGLSETSPVVTLGALHGIRRPGSIGTPVDGVEARLIDDDRKDTREGAVGEIAVRGPHVLRGPCPRSGHSPAHDGHRCPWMEVMSVCHQGRTGTGNR